MRPAVLVGRWFTAKYRKMLREKGAEYTIARMKRDGVHRHIARIILTGNL